MASAFSATRWVLFGSFGFRALAFFGQIIILRLVSKDVFGAYGALISLPLMLVPLYPLSFDQLLIREKARARRYVMALSFALAGIGGLVLLVGALLTLLLATQIGPWQEMLGAEVNATALAALLPVFAVMALKLSIRSMLAAKLEFKTISIGEFGNGIITFFGGAAAVMFFPSAWALISAYLLGEIFETWWIYRGHPFRPIAMLKPSRFRVFSKLYRQNQKFCLTNTLDLTLNSVGSLIPAPMIAFLISENATADFSASRILLQMPILLLAGAIWRVAFPTISGLPEEQLQDRCLRIIGTTAAFLAPGVLWLAFFAPTTAFLLGGESYLSAAPLVRWMAFYMILTAVYTPISSLDMIRNRPEVGLYWNIVHTVVRVIVIWFAAPHGIVVTIAAMSVASGFLWIIWAGMLGWLLDCGAKRYLTATMRFVPLWVILAIAYYGCLQVSDGSLRGNFMALAVSVPPGLIYLAVVMKFFPKEAEMVWRLLGRK